MEITDFAGGPDIAQSVLVMPDGAIVAAGQAWNGHDDDFALARYEAPALEVTIDIQPGNSDNTVYLRSPRTIPVAILSSTDFDAPAMLDRASLTFGRTGDEPSLISCEPVTSDVNSDGFPDLLCNFAVRRGGFRTGDSLGVLHGLTLDGRPISGQDALRVLK
jgi:hypothetical protein